MVVVGTGGQGDRSVGCPVTDTVDEGIDEPREGTTENDAKTAAGAPADRLLDAEALAAMVEERLGDRSLYAPSFVYVDETGRLHELEEALAVFVSRQSHPVVNACVETRPDGRLVLVYERIAPGVRWGEPWPAPAASVCILTVGDEGIEILERRDYGGFIADGR